LSKPKEPPPLDPPLGHHVPISPGSESVSNIKLLTSYKDKFSSKKAQCHLTLSRRQVTSARIIYFCRYLKGL